MQALSIVDTKAPDWKHACKVWPQPRTKAQNGEPKGQNWQTWSAATYLHAAKCVEEKALLLLRLCENINVLGMGIR